MVKNNIFLIFVFVGLVGCTPKPILTAFPVSNGEHPINQITVTESSNKPTETLVLSTNLPTATVLRTTPTFQPTTPVAVSTLTPTLTATPENNWGAANNSWIAFYTFGFKGKPSGIYIIHPDGTDGRQIIGLSGYYESLAWSPDGHWLAFAYSPPTVNNSFEIYVVQIDGNNLQRLTYGNDLYESGLSWSPDSQEIIYQREYEPKTSLQTDLHIITRNGDYIKRLSSFAYSEEISEDTPNWAPWGEIYFVRGSQILAIDPNSHKERLVFDLLTYDESANSVKIALSPSGKQIAISMWLANSQCDLFMMDVDGQHFQRLTETETLCEWTPSWSPDEKYIIFEENYCKQGQTAQRIWKLTTGEVASITASDIWNTPRGAVWSPVPALEIEKKYAVTAWNKNLFFRQTASLAGGAILRLEVGDVVTVLEGPVDKDGYYWWRLRTEDGVEGWAVEMAGWYEPVEAASGTPTPEP